MGRDPTKSIRRIFFKSQERSNGKILELTQIFSKNCQNSESVQIMKHHHTLMIFGDFMVILAKKKPILKMGYNLRNHIFQILRILNSKGGQNILKNHYNM